MSNIISQLSPPLWNIQIFADNLALIQSSQYGDDTSSPRAGGGIALQLYKDTYIGLLDILDVEEGEIFVTIAEERKAVELSHRVSIQETEKDIQINVYM